MMLKERKKAEDFFHSMVGTVVPWRLVTDIKSVLSEKRGLTVSLEVGWDRQDGWESSELMWSSTRSRSGGPSFGHPKSCHSHCAPQRLLLTSSSIRKAKSLLPTLLVRNSSGRVPWLSLHKGTFSSLLLGWRHWPKSTGLSGEQVIGSHLLLEKPGIYSQPDP